MHPPYTTLSLENQPRPTPSAFGARTFLSACTATRIFLSACAGAIKRKSLSLNSRHFSPAGLLAETRALLAVILFTQGGVAPVFANQPLTLTLLPTAQTDSEGLFLNQIVQEQPNLTLPSLRLCPAPALGQALVLTRTQITELLQKNASDWLPTTWTGPEKIRVTRRMRILAESDLKTLLTSQLQKEFARDRGELELRLVRPWQRVSVPDEPLTVKILDMPTIGLTPNFIARFELNAGSERVGSWQVPLQARLWRAVLVAHTHLLRGKLLRDVNAGPERRDLLSLRDPLLSDQVNDPTLELVENISPGTVLTARAVRQRPLVHRGDTVEAFLQDGSLSISLKVEALEDGAPGQTVRVRNLQSQREFRGKVQNEKTIVVLL